MSSEKKGADLDALLDPCVEVDLGEYGKARVFPFGARHLNRYAQDVAGAVAMLAAIDVTKADALGLKLQYLTRMGPYLMCNMLPLISECVRLEPKRDLMALPHWVLPKVVEAWVLHNFGTEEKWGPWVAVVEQLVKTLTNKDVRILEMLSKTLSKPGTNSPTSSTADVPAGRTADGASPKSSSGPDAPAASAPASAS